MLLKVYTSFITHRYSQLLLTMASLHVFQMLRCKKKTITLYTSLELTILLNRGAGALGYAVASTIGISFTAAMSRKFKLKEVPKF